MTSLPLHTQIEGFEVRDNCLAVNGRKLTDIVDEVGHTPLYVYVSNLIEARIRKLRMALPRDVKIHYAMKANPLPELVERVARHVDGIDVASAGELEVALKTNTPRHDISFAGPGKRPFEIDAAVAAGVVLNVESETEIERAAQSAKRLGKRANVAVRVNPDFELKGSGMRMSGGPKPFGIDSERVPNVLRGLAAPEFEFHGFHIFAGSQNLSADAICEAQSRSLALALELTRAAPSDPKFINIGGGFGIPYFPGDKPLDLGKVGTHLHQIVSDLRAAVPTCALVVELGRYIVGEAGIFVCRVVDKKISRGHTFLITDGGLHHHLAASGNFGQVIRKNYPVLIGSRVEGDTTPTTIVGPLCTPLDILADRVAVSDAQIGDLVVVFQSGAYGLTASPLGFLSHPGPRELLI